MVLTYFEIGRMIVEEEQNGKEKADYGKYLISEISERLSKDFGRGFSKRNVEQMRQFYINADSVCAIELKLYRIT